MPVEPPPKEYQRLAIRDFEERDQPFLIEKTESNTSTRSRVISENPSKAADLETEDIDSKVTVEGHFSPESPAGSTEAADSEALPLDDQVALILSSVRTWIETCKADHPACGSSRKAPTTLPTRVIDVGQANEIDSIRLIETDGKQGEYAALSYCWGTSGSNYGTTINSLEEHKERIPWNRLARTIQEAILVTRELGLQYLYVDALCIIQKTLLEDDSGVRTHSGDWAVEAGKMASVYQNAFITIAAASAADCRDGFLLRNDWFTPDSKLDEDTCTWKVFESPLHDRAWAFQEDLLSRKTVTFCAPVLQWCCKSTEAQKVVHEEYDLVGGGWVLRSNGPLSQIRWWLWIVYYTKRKLTYESDRLAAVSGVVEYFAQQTNDLPVLGLWKSDLIVGLLWNTTIPGTRNRSKEFSMPTWSWLSVNEIIHHRRCKDAKDVKYVLDVEVEKFQCDWDGPEMTGRLLRTDLVIRGCLEIAQVHEIPWDHDDWLRTTFHERYVVMPRLLLLAKGGQHVEGESSNTTKHRNAGYCMIDLKSDYESLIQEGAVVFCLQIAIRPQTQHSWASSPAVYITTDPIREVLLLKKSEKSTNTYERIGAGRIYVKDFLDFFKGPRESIRLV
ncbi:HET-domain-containing protein [Mytilinidion resinicola]|uniref:HET-domain-containing protein n=1 Tax=Mytilinidion resinicola TaxID=574789 RepID=A0A6A6YLY4_9PEZI|nr:HET-domain-containing protein [Mytilinidion resinicola]KAF2808877.1 HET-domain-containing protein [Mytilinidion resinicola]